VASNDQHGGIDDRDVGRADGCGGQPPGDEHLRAADRTHDQRLQQPVLRVTAHRRQREERGEHAAEEQRREHREPVEGGAGELVGVDAVRPGRVDRLMDLMERRSTAEREQHDEADGQQRDDEEDAPAQRLADRPRGEHRDRAPEADDGVHSLVLETASR
jgi:hypothetical protein